MRWRIGAAALSLAAFLCLSGDAHARPQPWIGKLEIVLPGFGETELDTGGGVATLEDAGVQLEAISLMGGLAGTTLLPVTDPLVSNGGLVAIRATAALGSGDLRIDPTGFFGGPILTDGTLPLPGNLRLCMLVPTNCDGLVMPLTRQTVNGTIGIGVGGMLTVGGLGTIRLSVLGAPWTINTASVRAQTGDGALVTLLSAGFVHGPLSFTGSGAVSISDEGGAVQLVTPIRVTTLPGLTGNREALGGFARLTLHFVPESGSLFLIGSGVVALVVAGRSRRMRPR